MTVRRLAPERDQSDAATTAPTSARLRELISAMQGRSILVLADLVADRFLFGTPRRVSREAPVLILEHEREELRAGGGANAVVNVRALGGALRALGRVGCDAPGRALLELLGAAGIDTSEVLESEHYSTPCKTRILGGAPHTLKQQIVRYDTGVPTPLSAHEVEQLQARLERAAGELAQASSPAVAVLSDYGYGFVLPEWVEPLRQALGPGSIVLVDSRYRLADFAGADGCTPNQEEAEAAVGRPLETREQILAAAPELLRSLGRRFVVVTRGSEGMALIERGREPGGARTAFLPASGRSAVTDVTGAGDTVIGAFALALAAGATPLEATALANYAGGVVVTKPGTATLDAAELRRAIAEDPEPLRELSLHTARG